MRQLPARLCVATIGAAATVGLAAPASAHTALVSSTPKSGAVLKTAPASVQLTFNEAVDPRLAFVVVSGSHRSDWADGRPVVTGAGLEQRLRPLGPAGRYRVAYRVISDDGHPVTGTLLFTMTSTVGVSSPTVPSAGVTAGQDLGGSGESLPAVAFGVLGLIGAGAVVAARRRRRPPRILAEKARPRSW